MGRRAETGGAGYLRALQLVAAGSLCAAAALLAEELALGPGSAMAVVATLALGATGALALGLAGRAQAHVRSLERAAGTDPLTGLLNRRAFQERLESDLALSERSGTSLVLVMIDLDDFKAINDQHGHLGGDMALERIAGVIRGTSRRGDAAGRLGGDEFAIVLPDTSELQAFAAAERLRQQVQGSFEGTPVGLSVSLGLAMFPESGRSAEQLLHAADQAMYKAKALGKNRSAVHTDTAASERALVSQ